VSNKLDDDRRDQLDNRSITRFVFGSLTSGDKEKWQRGVIFGLSGCQVFGCPSIPFPSKMTDPHDQVMITANDCPCWALCCPFPSQQDPRVDTLNAPLKMQSH